MKDKNYYTHRLIKIAKTFKNIVIIATVLYAFYVVSYVENHDYKSGLIFSLIANFIFTFIVIIVVDKNFQYSKIPDIQMNGFEVIKPSESYIKGRGDEEDIGNIKGLLRGYNFEYRKGRKVSYTEIKLFESNIEDNDFKKFLDYTFEAHGYFPTGRVVFRGYWALNKSDKKYYKINKFLVDKFGSAVYIGSKICILSSDHRVIERGVVVDLDGDYVIYRNERGINGHINHEKVAAI